MMKVDQSLVDTLKSLLRSCQYAALGFKLAARYVRLPAMKTAFADLSADYANHMQALARVVRRLGGNPKIGGEIPRQIRRDWDLLKPTLGEGGHEDVLTVCEDAHVTTIGFYVRILQDDMEIAPEIQRLLTQQHDALAARVDELDALHDELTSFQTSLPG